MYCVNKAIKHRLLLRPETWEMALTPNKINSMGMGCTVTEVEDKTPWQEATKAVLEENIAGMEDVYEAIVALQ